MRHDLLVYDSDEHYAEQLVPFFEAGLDAGEALLAIPGRATDPLLRDALGAASERVQFHACEDWYTRPEAALAGYDAVVRGFLRDGAPAVRLAAELPFCSSQGQWDGWVRYEAIINRAFAQRPVSIICTCDARVLPAHVLDAMYHTHSHVVSDGRHESPHYRDPVEVVKSVAVAPEPLPPLHDVPVGADGPELRDALSRALQGAGVAADKAQEMIVAAGEVVVNAERHGDGVRTLRVGGGDGTFVCEVSDAGRGLEDPLAGYLPPGAQGGHGGGLWVARQLTRRLDLVPSPQGGLTVRLWA